MDGQQQSLGADLELLARQRQQETRDRLDRFEQVDNRLLVATGAASWPFVSQQQLGDFLAPLLIGQPDVAQESLVSLARVAAPNKTSGAASADSPLERLYSAQVLSLLIGLVCSALVVALFLTRRSDGRLLQQLATGAAPARKDSPPRTTGGRRRSAWRRFWARRESDLESSNAGDDEELVSAARCASSAKTQALGASNVAEQQRKGAKALAERLAAFVGVARRLDSTSASDSGAETATSASSQVKVSVRRECWRTNYRRASK